MLKKNIYKLSGDSSVEISFPLEYEIDASVLTSLKE